MQSPATAGAAARQPGGQAAHPLLHRVQLRTPRPPGPADCLDFARKCCERYVKVAEPQNGENIEQRAGGVSAGTGELRTRAEKVPRAKRVSFQDGDGVNFFGVESFGGF